MLPRINPTQTPAWKKLKEHQATLTQTNMRELFRQDPERFVKYSLCTKDLVFDYSKNIINDKTLALLNELAVSTKLPEAIKSMFNGELINATENRAVLHTALRNFSGKPVFTQEWMLCPVLKSPEKNEGLL